MNIIKPYFVIETEIDSKSILKNIEKAGRTAYKSEDKITEDSA
jgi:thymidylate synthase (FAD)